MTSWRLVIRSLRYYWRSHLGVVAGSAVAAAVLTGALLVGDSMRGSLHALALQRLGTVQLAISTGDRFFRAALAEDLQADLSTTAAPALILRGTATSADGTTRANDVQVIGVDDRFWSLSSGRTPFKPGDDVTAVNSRLAVQLNLRTGESIVLRFERPSLLPREAPLSTLGNSSEAFRLEVSSIVSEGNLGNFNLQANQISPFNAFVPLSWLGEKIGMPGRANLMLLSGNSKNEIALDAAEASVKRRWQLADVDLELRRLPEQGMLEFRTGRIFLDPSAEHAAMQAGQDAIGIVTYFVNELRVGERTTPYSMVTAISPAGLPGPLNDDEILINDWLADDLGARPGDRLELTCFVLGPARRLETRSQAFRICAIVPMKGIAADPELMPDFPGLAAVEDCRDWDPGLPIDLSNIRPKDEDYWNRHRGTPKAFVTLNAGRRMWANRYGELTAVRYPISSNTESALMLSIRNGLDPSSAGLFFTPVGQIALSAGSQSPDFGQLFLGFSFFLIIAALLLMGLLFVFGVEQRSEEVGTLLALGFRPRRVRRLFFLEGGLLAVIGGLVGTGAGTMYTKIVLHGLSTLWRQAVGTSSLQYHAEPSTLIIGAVSAGGVGVMAIWLTLRNQARRPARELLSADVEPGQPSRSGAGRSRIGLWLGLFTLAAATIVLIAAGAGRDRTAAGAFFTAGGLLLIGGIGFSHYLLRAMGRAAGKSQLSLTGLGTRNSARRIGRSLAVVALLACGAFLIVAVGANRHDPNEAAENRSSGTGGFALFGRSSLPIFADLNTPAGRDAYGLDSPILEHVEIVPIRVHDGDDASCLNLNRAQRPRLLGVDPKEFQTRGAFTFTGTMPDLDANDEPWMLLNQMADENTVYAIGDEATITWALGKSVGQTLAYVDERGRQFNIRLVGAIANTILQGSLLISNDAFLSRFPSDAGYRMFLIDAPVQDRANAAKTLGQALQNAGLELTIASDRLAAFNAVENTYLSIFQALGGLGLILGSAGLGVVVLRNVLERQSELALLHAVGFSNHMLRKLILCEHALLLLLGLAVGLIASVIAVLPALRSAGAHVPYVSLTATVLAVAVSGVVWTWLATATSLRRPLLSALRNE